MDLVTSGEVNEVSEAHSRREHSSGNALLLVLGTGGPIPFKEALMGITSHRLAQLGKVPLTIAP